MRGSRRVCACVAVALVLAGSSAPGVLAAAQDGDGSGPATELWEDYPLEEPTVEPPPAATAAATAAPAPADADPGPGVPTAVVLVLLLAAPVVVGVRLALRRQRAAPAAPPALQAADRPAPAAPPALQAADRPDSPGRSSPARLFAPEGQPPGAPPGAPARFERQDPLAPPDPGRAWTAEIVWRQSGALARFHAIAERDGAQGADVAASDPVPWPPAGPADVQALTAAVENLEDRLRAAGWRPLGATAAWYARRFAWEPIERHRGAAVVAGERSS
jgi:hypothetical protein